MNDDDGDEPQHAERRTRVVTIVTAVTMVAEIGAGWWFNSMALLADGWHMGTHAVAIGLAALAYALVRRWRSDARFAFGPWKVEILAAFTSAVALLAAALGIAAASAERLVAPRPIRYEEAMVVAAIGLAVNLLCAWLLGAHGSHGHDHGGGHASRRGHGHGEGDARGHGPEHGHHDHEGRDHDHDHDADHSHGNRGREHARRGESHDVSHAGGAHDHAHGPSHAGPRAPDLAPHADLNLRSAYLHVLADAATSALAIVALAGGLWLGLDGLDPLMGLLGAMLVGRWGVLLMRDTGRVLLDREMDDPLPRSVRQALGDAAPWAAAAEIVDWRMWRVGRNDWACALRLRSRDPGLSVQQVRDWLARWPQLRQSTIEIDCR